MLTAGVAISYDGEAFLLYATLGILMSDGDGLRKATGWKGAGSMRPCFKHDNCLRKNSGLTDRLPGWYEITHNVPADFHRRSAADFFDSADKVEAAHRRWKDGRITKGLYQQISKAEALNYHPLALPWRLSLRHSINWFDKFTYDWVHTLLQGGPLEIEIFCYLKACKEFVDFPMVRDWLLLNWVFPAQLGSKGSNLWRIFSEWRQNKQTGEHDRLHASCSELLGSYQLVRLLLDLKVPAFSSRTIFVVFVVLCVVFVFCT